MKTRKNNSELQNNARAYSANYKPSKSDVGLSNVDNIRQYSVNNPPPLFIHYISISIRMTVRGDEVGGVLMTLASTSKIWNDDDDYETIVSKVRAYIQSHNGVETYVQQVAGSMFNNTFENITQVNLESDTMCNVMVAGSSWLTDVYYRFDITRIMQV